MRRMPVPASMMMRVPAAELTSTHDVLPPYRSVRGPGTGKEPLTPQNRILMFRRGSRAWLQKILSQRQNLRASMKRSLERYSTTCTRVIDLPQPIPNENAKLGTHELALAVSPETESKV
jgi:hypothetical protein